VAGDPALERFVRAQDADGVYQRALAELRAGRKRSHWMWFVFPQLAGLGHSQMAQRYAIASLAEAKRYLAHPVLGPRLRECAQALLDLHGAPSAAEILGEIDALKLRSSMTLFSRAAAEPDSIFPLGARPLLRRRTRPAHREPALKTTGDRPVGALDREKTHCRQPSQPCHKGRLCRPGA
jgi:uncharacterized protein (DUF1810 family)